MNPRHMYRLRVGDPELRWNTLGFKNTLYNSSRPQQWNTNVKNYPQKVSSGNGARSRPRRRAAQQSGVCSERRLFRDKALAQLLLRKWQFSWKRHVFKLPIGAVTPSTGNATPHLFQYGTEARSASEVFWARDMVVPGTDYCDWEVMVSLLGEVMVS